MLSFPKPLVAAVNGDAIGCGVSILPLFDVVYASDKAIFSTPYTRLGQVPEAGITHSLPTVVGSALVSLSRHQYSISILLVSLSRHQYSISISKSL